MGKFGYIELMREVDLNENTALIKTPHFECLPWSIGEAIVECALNTLI